MRSWGILLLSVCAIAPIRAQLDKEKASTSIEPLTRAIEQQTNATKLAELYFYRARALEALGVDDKAVADVTKTIELQTNSVSAYQKRGVLQFKLGKMKEAIEDFDKVIELRPDQEAHHWQRGIAYYYAGEYKKGRKQFELHQTVNGNDVENAVWHFLCVARDENFESARKLLIPVTEDSRVPMAEVQRLFAGEAQPEEVLRAADVTGVEANARANSLFYAHLYLGLFEEARGNAEKSLEHIRKAAGEYGQPHYMGDVARIHLRLRSAK